ncbi:MAG: hypothetical protein KC583_02670, partial [Myxococcales bacterium]|nr:hypothetical protein [Myxococcales bacterium]
DDPLPMLDQPMSGEETNALRMGFDWAATEPWPEVDPDGRPALFYALILVASEDDRRNLDLAEIHHWSLPLFPEERARWDGQVGVVAPVGDGYGAFEFAILPGAAFNVLREAALEGEVVFEVITRREPPPGYTHPDGSLRYDALLRGGFRYDPHVGIEAGRSQPPAIGFRVEPFIGEIIALVLALDRDARDAVEDAAGDIDHAFRDLVPVRLRVDVRNTDPAFNPPSPAAPFAMRRAWPSALDGFRRGFQLPLEHVQLVYGVGLGHHRVWSDVRGEATVEIGRDADYLVCLRMENHAAFISELWESVQVCDFNSGRVVVNVPAETTVSVTVADWRVNILAQMTDAWRYARERLGHTPRRPARVLVGFLADIFGSFNGNRAFALCGGFGTLQALEFEALIAGVSGVIAATPLPPDWIAVAQIGVQVFARTALGFDIMFPGGGGVNATISRGVPTHEYGHFLTCEMAHAIDSWKLSESWIDVVNTSLGTGQAPGVENLYVIEAIADYFASQVVGGVNYFDPPNSTFATSLEYCEPGALCMDENFGGPALPAAGSFRNQLAAMSTLLFDVFDGRAGFVSDTAGPGAACEAGVNASLEFAPDVTPPPGPPDESIALPSQAFFEVFQNWAAASNTWNHRNIVRALVRTMRDHGYSDIQICQVLALHSDTGRCEDVPGGDLEVADFPPARPLITASPVRPVDAVRWDWRDVSVTATGFEVDFGAEGEAPARSAVAYAREASFEADALSPNTTYRFQVRTVNGEVASGWATDRVTTLPERVSVAPTLTPLRGGLDVDWDAVAADRYEVEWSKRSGACDDADPCAGDARCVRGLCETTRRLPAPGPGLTLEGLEAGVDHTVRIIALNGDGDAVDPSPPAVGVPLAPEVIFVSGAGDDAQSGEEGAPVRTLATAIERARDGAQIIRIVGDIGMQQGPFVLPEGVALDGAGATLQVRGYAPTGTCRGAGFNPTRRPTFAAIQSEGETLRVSNLSVAFLTYDTDPADACLVGFSSTDGSLVLDNVFVTHTEYGAAGGARCRAAAQATGGDLEIRGSTLAGVYSLVGAANLRAVGVCMADGRSVTVTDSRLVGYEQPNFNAPFPAVAAVGLDVNAVTTVRISRADLLASPQGTASGGEH